MSVEVRAHIVYYRTILKTRTLGLLAFTDAPLRGHRTRRAALYDHHWGVLLGSAAAYLSFLVLLMSSPSTLLHWFTQSCNILFVTPNWIPTLCTHCHIQT